ncbi:MAG: pentapeptide repeat-containing protein [SAR324 cluster bacterium]|nr:pentapeptide repeat-containing protein [SAR324 cluster bacterium]
MQLSKELFVKLKQTVSFFQSLSDGELLALLKLAVSESFGDGEVVFKEKSRGDQMYIILTGTIRISKYLGAKKEDVLAKLTSGACFGEMGVIDQSPRSASATVEGGPAVLLVISGTQLSEKNILLSYKLYKSFSIMLAQRLRETNEKLHNAATGDRDASAQLKSLLKKRLDQGHSMEGANLRGADLTEVFMNNANLQNAILINAKFTDTKCKQTNFSNAKMIGAELNSITFEGANFQGADFTGSKFQNVEFSSCDMKGANFTAAEMPEVTGLDAVTETEKPSVTEPEKPSVTKPEKPVK